MFASEFDGKTLHTYVNTKHKNIKFTYEKQIENELPFLDYLISNNENLQTSVFHKKMYTGLLLNYFSFVPNSYEYGLIKTLIDRMHRINKTRTSFDIDLKNLKQVLLKNQYPLSMTDNVIKKCLQNVKLVFTSDKLHQTFTFKDSYTSVLSRRATRNFSGQWRFCGIRALQ